MEQSFRRVTKSILLNTLSFGSKGNDGLGFLECLDKIGDTEVSEYKFPDSFHNYINSLRSEEMSDSFIKANVTSVAQFEALQLTLKNEMIKNMGLGYKLLTLAKSAKTDIDYVIIII